MYWHRDLKLSNLMLDKYSRVKVCDFGATLLIDKRQETKQDREDPGGSVPYMAPEVIFLKYITQVSQIFLPKDVKSSF